MLAGSGDYKPIKHCAGYFSWDDYEQVTDRLHPIFGPDIPIAEIYANSHGPNAPSRSSCKTSPAMLLTAAQNINLDLSPGRKINIR